MKAEIICFSENGKKTALQVKRILQEEFDVTLWLKSKYAAEDENFISLSGSLPPWTADHWDRQLIVFVGALGIAVRAISGSVASKKTDPAIVVLDERMQFCIPLLSGHLGGANAYASLISGATGSLPVITTATDINKLFAVDVFAKKNGLVIDNMVYAKEVSAALLAGKRIGVYSELPIKQDKLPRGLCLIGDRSQGASYELGIYIGIHTDADCFPKTLRLIPDILCLGMGCRKNQSFENTENLFLTLLDTYKLDKRAICSLSSIDLKKEEPSLIGLASRLNIPFQCYTAAELNEVKGEFTPSAFVREITGVDNVCERSAMKAAASDTLMIKKMPLNGVTAAAAVRKRRIDFE